MKIVICTNHYSPSIGGCEIVTEKIAEYLSADHDITVATRRMPGRNLSNFKYKILEYAPGDPRSFVEKLKSIQPQVILVYSDVFDFFRSLITRPMTGKLVLALCGANWLHSNKTFVRIFYRNLPNIHSIICHSEYDRDYRLCTEPNFLSKTHIIPNGVDIEEFNTSVSREELVDKYKVKKEVLGRKWILNVSNFFPGKGQEHLVDVLGSHFQNNEYHYFQVSSDIPFDIGKTLEIQWKQSLQTKKVSTTLLKNIPREDVIGFFNNSNVFAFTSEKEVAPIVILEAMAAKLPWVAADVGNIRGLAGGKFVPALKDRNYHSIFDDRVKNSFAGYIKNVWQSPAIGENGRIQIEKEMTWDIVLPKYKSIIEKCD